MVGKQSTNNHRPPQDNSHKQSKHMIASLRKRVIRKPLTKANSIDLSEVSPNPKTKKQNWAITSLNDFSKLANTH